MKDNYTFSIFPGRGEDPEKHKCACFQSLPDLDPIFHRIYSDWIDLKDVNPDDIRKYVDNLDLRISFGPPCREGCNILMFMSESNLTRYIGYYIAHIVTSKATGFHPKYGGFVYKLNYAHWKPFSSMSDYRPNTWYLDELMATYLDRLSGLPQVLRCLRIPYPVLDQLGRSKVNGVIELDFSSYLTQYDCPLKGFVESHKVDFESGVGKLQQKYPTYHDIPTAGYMSPYYLGFYVSLHI